MSSDVASGPNKGLHREDIVGEDVSRSDNWRCLSGSVAIVSHGWKTAVGRDVAGNETWSRLAGNVAIVSHGGETMVEGDITVRITCSSTAKHGWMRVEIKIRILEIQQMYDIPVNKKFSSL